MTERQAEAILRDFFAPASLDDFLGALGDHSFDVPAAPDATPRKLFGDEPKRTLLGGYASHATQLKSYGMAPPLPPPATRPASSPEDFRELISSFHERDYTVRVPDVIPLSPQLQELARALETLLHQPVQAAAFWSKAEAKAIVHYDNRDNIVIFSIAGDQTLRLPHHVELTRRACRTTGSRSESRCRSCRATGSSTPSRVT